MLIAHANLHRHMAHRRVFLVQGLARPIPTYTPHSPSYNGVVRRRCDRVPPLGRSGRRPHPPTPLPTGPISLSLTLDCENPKRRRAWGSLFARQMFSLRLQRPAVIGHAAWPLDKGHARINNCHCKAERFPAHVWRCSSGACLTDATAACIEDTDESSGTRSHLRDRGALMATRHDGSVRLLALPNGRQ